MPHDKPISDLVRHPSPRNVEPLVTVRDLNLWCGERQAPIDELCPSEILAFIGPSGCGKSTALKCLNRMHDGMRDLRGTGLITLDGRDIDGPAIDPPLHWRRLGWVAQAPNPLPVTIYENVAYAPRTHGLSASQAELVVHVEDCLRHAHLWDEVKDDPHRKSGPDLSIGQQQRLCIAHAVAEAQPAADRRADRLHRPDRHEAGLEFSRRPEGRPCDRRGDAFDDGGEAHRRSHRLSPSRSPVPPRFPRHRFATTRPAGACPVARRSG